jgi:hypothetical protein
VEVEWDRVRKEHARDRRRFELAAVEDAQLGRVGETRRLEHTMGDAHPFQTLVLRSGIAFREGLLAWLNGLPFERAAAEPKAKARGRGRRS